MANGGTPVSATIGHNVQGLSIDIEVRFFNSILPYANGKGVRQTLAVEPGTTIGELAARLAIPLDKLFLVLVNGRDVTKGLVGAGIDGRYMVEAGDVVAFSGAVPYSYGYGAPVV